MTAIAKRLFEADQLSLLSEVLESLPLFILVYSPRRGIEWVSPELTRLLGWTAEDLREVSRLSSLFFTDAGLAVDLFSSHPETIVDWPEVQIKSKNAGLVSCAWRIDRSTEGIVIAIGADISLAKAQAAKIAQQHVQILGASRLSSLGEMASGIAHEINNPLAIISAKAAQMKRALQRDNLDRDQMLAGLQKIDETAHRIGKIVKGLQAFSRSEVEADYETVQLISVVRQVLDLCFEKFHSSGVEIRVEIEPALTLDCRPVQLGQVLMNLINNAWDAIGSGARTSGSCFVEVKAEVVGEWIEILVIDSGPGIPEDLVKKIMDPFFTTKEVGHGTGIGLSISQAILEKHGGKLELARPRDSTTFRILLPQRQSKNART